MPRHAKTHSLVVCLKHPEYGYRQGMHELLAPLLYVLNVDIMRLSQVRKDYDDYFTDRFDSLSFEERDISYTFDFNKFMDEDELDPEVQSIGVEPQYFGLRWLRVLFGREFTLQSLLLVWDEIFSADNSARTVTHDDEDSRNHMFRDFDCPRGTLISGMAVLMLLYLRSSLLSTENATCCLQRLLNFPEEIDLKKIIQKAKCLQALVLSSNGVFEQISFVPARTKIVPSGLVSPNSPLFVTPESYWEEKWRLLQKSKEEEERQMSSPTQKKNRWLKVTILFRSVTDLSRYKTQSVLEDLSQKLSPNPQEANDFHVNVIKENISPQETEESSMDFHTADEESSEESSSVYIDSNYLENDSDSGAASNLSPDENDISIDSLTAENSPAYSEPTSPAARACSTSSDSVPDENCKGQKACVDSPLPISPYSRNEYPRTQSNEEDSTDKSVRIITKEHKLLSGIVQWVLKCKHSFFGEESKENQVECYSESHPQALSSPINGESDSNLMKNLKNLG